MFGQYAKYLQQVIKKFGLHKKRSEKIKAILFFYYEIISSSTPAVLLKLQTFFYIPVAVNDIPAHCINSF